VYRKAPRRSIVRLASGADLLIAAAAEAGGIPVLHYDEDYDRIAAITGQEVRWLASRGSLRAVMCQSPASRAEATACASAMHSSMLM
jgi:hypothetical protein